MSGAARDLFGHVEPDRYPDAPGHRGIETSIAAAEAIASSAPVIRERVLRAISDAGPSGLTVIEFCNRTGVDRMGAQPRFSELRKERRIIDSGLRRKNPSGVNAIAWALPIYERGPDHAE